MKPEHWHQINQLFHAALEHEPTERAEFLDTACAGDESMRKQIDALLAAHAAAGTFIEEDALQFEARALANERQMQDGILTSGAVLGHYRIISLLSVGGMGEVYLAHDTHLGRQLALKLLPRSFTNDKQRVRRFQQEARAASSLNHSNIITIYQVGEIGGRHFIASEYVDGETLRKHFNVSRSSVATDDGMRAAQISKALSIAMQVADALAAAHEKGIVHRDIKPENIMLVSVRQLMRPKDLVKVLDFGIAKLIEPVTDGSEGEETTRVLLNTHEGSVIGTASYMSPEQARGEPVDARTDVWSLGVVLYEMLSNGAPFSGRTTQDVIASILKEEPAQLSTEIPDRLRRIVEKALRKDREERYQTAREMFSDLRDLQDGEDAGRVAHLREQTDPQRLTIPGAVVPAENSSIVRGLFDRVTRHAEVWGVALTAFIVIAAFFVFGLYRFSHRNQGQTNQNQARSAVTFQTMKLARLTTTGKATAAAISPDGKNVVHVVDDGQQQSLWLRQVSTSSNVQINPAAAVTYQGLTFAPGGEYFYYVVWDRITAFALYRMPLFGGTAQKLITDIDSNITFSPDGRQFAFLRGYPTQGKTTLVVANADGTSERKLSDHELVVGPFGDPAWSPDGKVIAYPTENAAGTGDFMTLVEVWVADGSEKMISSQHWWRVGRMAWLRDGSGLLFTARETVGSPSQIWYLSYPGGEVRRMTNDLSDYLDLSLTADSSTIAIIQSEQVSNIWLAPNENLHRTSQLTFSKFDGQRSISWTPDRKIVYDSGASGHLDLWITDTNGTGQKQLTADAGNNSSPSVSPDGRYVVFVSDRTGIDHIWRIDIDGSNARQLTNGNGEINPQCSPAGEWVVFNSRFGGEPLSKVPLDGGAPVGIMAKTSSGVAVSPDGKWIASTHYEPANINTAIYPFEGGEPQKMLNVSSYYFRWTPDGRALAYLDERNPSVINSQLIDGDGAEKQLTELKPDRIFSFAWSDDGKQLAVARGSLTHDVILISNFLEHR